MKYAEYRRQGMPIGSGVTEAACKTVFTERLKRSGMTWSHEGGQVILDLRVLVLSSGVARQPTSAYLRTKPQPTVSKPASQRVCSGHKLKKAAIISGKGATAPRSQAVPLTVALSRPLSQHRLSGSTTINTGALT